jgi:hypothetical protein
MPGERVPIEQESGWAPDLFCTLWRREKSLTVAGTNDVYSVLQPEA